MSAPAGTRIDALIRSGPNEAELVPARASGVPGLIVNMDPRANDLWGVTHERSGLALGFWTSDPELIIRFAHELRTLADWTLSGEDLRALEPELTSAIGAAGRRLGLKLLLNRAGDAGDLERVGDSLMPLPLGQNRDSR
jgi:hypothetical protein